jgi:hypothetical protein
MIGDCVVAGFGDSWDRSRFPRIAGVKCSASPLDLLVALGHII